MQRALPFSLCIGATYLNLQSWQKLEYFENCS